MPAKSDLMAGILNTYGEKLKDPRWQRLRLEVMRRDNFACRLCGDNTTTLNIHHLKYSGNPWEAPKDFLWTLCEDCHSIVSANNFDLFAQVVTIRKINYDQFTTILVCYDYGIGFYNKREGWLKPQFCVPHSALGFAVQDIINYWLQTDRQNLLSDKSINPNPEK